MLFSERYEMKPTPIDGVSYSPICCCQCLQECYFEVNRPQLRTGHWETADSNRCAWSLSSLTDCICKSSICAQRTPSTISLRYCIKHRKCCKLEIPLYLCVNTTRLLDERYRKLLFPSARINKKSRILSFPLLKPSVPRLTVCCGPHHANRVSAPPEAVQG